VSAPQLFLLAWGLSAALMVVLWLVQLRTRNAGLVDVGWAASIGGMGILYALLGDGSPTHRVLAALLPGIWGGRLAWHLLVDRVIGEPEEGRYQRLREIWGDRADAYLFPFFQGQALLAAILSLPFLGAARSTASGIGLVEITAVALWAIGILGEAIADRQLYAWKRDPDRTGKVCDVGLWRYSRHPNYFFEWVIWLGFGALSIGTSMWWAGLLSAVLMFVFITRITGIPPTEAQSLRSRGEAYREYQQRTSAFVPWFPKES